MFHFYFISFHFAKFPIPLLLKRHVNLYKYKRKKQILARHFNLTSPSSSFCTYSSYNSFDKEINCFSAGIQNEKKNVILHLRATNITMNKIIFLIHFTQRLRKRRHKIILWRTISEKTQLHLAFIIKISYGFKHMK